MTTVETEPAVTPRRRWLPSWRRLLIVLVVCGVIAFGAAQAWAWYHFDAGTAAVAKYHNAAARAHLEHCLRVWPNNPAVHLLMARVERRARNFAEAEKHLDLCRQQSDPLASDPVALEWALLRAAMGDLSAVEESLQARLERRPAEAPLIWEALAEGYRRTLRAPEALACLDTWGFFEPNNAQVHVLRGELHTLLGDVSRMRDEFQCVVEMDPENDAARYSLAYSLVLLGRFEQADAHLRTLLRKSPDDRETLTLLARAEHGLGQQAAAIDRLEAVLRSHPDYGPALRERGRAALTAEDYVQAESWLRRAVAIIPNDYETQWALAEALRGQGRTAEAKAQRARAQEVNDRRERINAIQSRELATKQNDPKLQCELGKLLLANGQLEPAERWLLNALRLDPTLAATHTALAELYQQRGDSARAEAHRRAAEGELR